jgi:hypothetical protein
MYILSHHETPSYFSVDFVSFSRHKERMLCPQSRKVLEKTSALFKHPLFTDWAFYPFAILFCYTVVFLAFFTAVTVIIFVGITRVGNLQVHHPRCVYVNQKKEVGSL